MSDMVGSPVGMVLRGFDVSFWGARGGLEPQNGASFGLF